LVLTDVAVDGRHVELAGVASDSLDGRLVALKGTWDGKVVARARVEDGVFGTIAYLPPKRIRHTNRARDEASIAGVAYSPALKLTRRAHYTHIAVTSVTSADATGGILTVRGRVTLPLPRHRSPLLLTAYDPAACGTSPRVIERVRLHRDGHFSFRVALPPSSAPVVYRLQTKVAAHAGGRVAGETYTLPLALDINPSQALGSDPGKAGGHHVTG
jgi:hypothetical protein